ncbi:D-alanyl-D-alanine carboxypeptidase family protein [Litorivicinus lipolyticus]|uniref:D-alanyl-D-alanine carboxypeptidase family protein n=1 Tax=Litorivicinus lipolyticus TaxID=418701 RepID=UPI003B599277
MRLLTLPLLLTLSSWVMAATLTVPVPTSIKRPVPSAPSLAASSYLLIDGSTGTVIVESNADQPLPPASLTKLMTAYLVEKDLKAGTVTLEDSVPISVKAWKTGGSRMFIREGTQVEMGDLLKGIIIQSGNDASVAVAEFLGGSEGGFAELMTAQASALGMTNTTYYNATGLPAPGHLTTARDLSILAREIIYGHPDLYSLYSQKSFTYNDIKQDNRNRLLWKDPSVDGLKTGHTEEAGYCLVASAERNGMRLISVVMGTKSTQSREQETAKLLNYGFRFFEGVSLFQAGQTLDTSARVWGGERDVVSLGPKDAVYLTLPKGARESLSVSLDMQPELVAPIAQGQQIGMLSVTLEGETLALVPVIATEAVVDGSLFKQAMDWVLRAVQ